MSTSDRGLLAWVLVGCLLTSSVPVATAAAPIASTSPTLAISPGTLSFAAQQATTASHPQTVTVTNTGTASVTLKSISLSGNEAVDFSQSHTCGASIAAHASCSIKVVFKPATAGLKSATLALTDSASNSPQNVVLKGTGVVPVFGVGTSHLTVTAAPTASTPLPSIGLTVTNPDAATPFYSATFSGSAVTGVNIQWNSPVINGRLTGFAELQVDLPAQQGSGTFTSTVILNACWDLACKKPMTGSPQKVSVTYVVTGNAIPNGIFALTPTSLNFEVPSNGTGPPATFDLIAYELPPYAVYASYKNSSTKAIRSMSFSGFPSTGGYGTGELKVIFAPPAQLGPGVYNDTITLSVCYDAACKKPAVGSPWLIPVTYTVTASLGREFEQRIVPISAQAIAADPSGSTLYLADWEYTQTSQANLIKLNPATGATLATVPLDGPPSRLAISADGKYAYVAVSLTATATQEIERVKLATMSVDLRIPFTQLFVAIGDLKVSPVDAHTIAVEYSYDDPIAGSLLDIAILDDGVARRKILSTGPGNAYSTNIQWRPDGTRLYVRDPTSMSVSAVESDGLAKPSQILALAYGDGFFGAAFHELNGLLYSDAGGVLDPATHKTLGEFAFRTPQSQTTGEGVNLEPDSATKRAFAAYGDVGSAAVLNTIQSFDLTRFTPVWIARFPLPVSSPVRWGTDGLAFIALNLGSTTGEFIVYVIHGSFVAP